MSYTGQTVWVTGASSGIGEGLAKAFARAGASVILSGRRVGELERVADAIGGSTLVLPFEATAYDALPEVVRTAQQWRGRIDMLVNNAGISQRSLAVDTSFEVYRRLMEVDFFAPVRLTQLVLPDMVARGSGHLMAISSVAGKVGSPLRTGYSAAKHAIIGYFDALRAETARHGLQVTIVTPGYVRTGVGTNALTGDGTPQGYSDDYIDTGISPDEAARQVLEGIAAGIREVAVGAPGGPEMALLELKRNDPEALFDAMAAMASRL